MGVLEGLTEGVDDLVSQDASSLADPGTVVALHRQLARLEAVVTRVVGTFDALQEYAPDGAPARRRGCRCSAACRWPAAGGGCAWAEPCATCR